MSTLTTNQTKWKGYEKAAFRFFFIYFVLQALPLDWKYFGNLFRIQWGSLSFGDIFYISRYTPQFVSGSTTPGTWGIGTLADWALLAGIALIGAIVWSLSDKKSENYNKLYYWLRVILRYRLAIGIIAYGFIKFFPMQSPLPSISNLNTSYGDFNRWKLFSLSLGIVPGYESFLGLVEIIVGLLLLFRKTTTFGAVIILIFTGNVFISNIAYDGGEALYALYLISIALILTAYDALRIYNLVALRKPTAPNTVKISLSGQWRASRLVLKSLFIFFFVFLYGYKTYAAYHYDIYQYPKAKGLAGAAGLYNVSDFRINSKQLPYSQTDTNRWNDVVFEKWNTISIGSLKRFKADTSVTEEISRNNDDRKYELDGTTGRAYYSYVADTVKHVLLLKNRNSNYKADQFSLNYARSANGTIVLKGVDHNRDSVYAQLDKVNKKYLLQEAKQGRSKALKL
ncbi:DoxX family protein [Mucilaginibacter celer]|uniref:DoxX family protein n=1 Tax=Mucilaginibacter celer TaxID=2305508 RepID=A0A494VN06_9SPHI|nr:DoxX family protein [Mucilaginibacter celer]AYL95081.1 DoxX family protein [Mucilaginibacter celer]